MPTRTRCLLVSDFNMETFRTYLDDGEDGPDIDAVPAPYGQVVPILKGHGFEGAAPPGCAVVWTRPEGIIPSFRAILEHRPVSLDTVLDEVDAFSRQVAGFHERVNTVVLPTWVLPPDTAAGGMLSLEHGAGATNILMRMNLRLAENFEKAPGIRLLDAQRWVWQAGRKAFNPKLWYMCKVPFANEVFQAAATDVKSALRGLSGDARKLLVLDLDNTLWGGTVGETGWQGLNLGGHNALGEAYADFQAALKALTRRGVILGLCSKNTESIALEAVRRHPEMVLSLNDFAGWRINWRDKAQNVSDLVDELGLGLQSTVFIDDNPVERDRVREALPEVAVPDWPRNAMFYKSALLALPYFDVPALAGEDLSRSRMYADERKRKAVRDEMASAEDWLKTLEIRVRAEPLNEANLRRTVQLLNKTNQMNLSTRRLDERELLTWLKDGRRTLWTFRVVDKFGDSGLCGVLSLEAEAAAARIVDFILSCRVIGRKVEETMLHTAVSHARALGLEEVYADFIPTPRNEPCRTFFRQSGMRRERGGDRFAWKTDRGYPLPDAVTLEEPQKLAPV